MATSLRLLAPLSANISLKPNSHRYLPKSIPIITTTNTINTTLRCAPSANPIPEETTTTTTIPEEASTTTTTTIPEETTTNTDSKEEEPDTSFEAPPEELSATDPSLAISKRVPSAITRRSGSVICPLEPPNFEIGWKRTIEIKNEKPKGWQIADFLEKLDGLMERGKYGSTKLLAKTTQIVVERANEEAEILREKGEVDDRVVTELQRVLRLVELDAEMVKAAVKEETLKERIETARARCRQAILVALSL